MLKSKLEPKINFEIKLNDNHSNYNSELIYKAPIEGYYCINGKTTFLKKGEKTHILKVIDNEEVFN